MKTLSDAQIAERQTLANDLTDQAKDITSAMAEINRLVSERLNPAIDNYNAALAAAAAFRDQVAAEMRQTTVTNEPSGFAAWLSDWANLDLNPVPPVLGFEGPETHHAEELICLPIEP